MTYTRLSSPLTLAYKLLLPGLTLLALAGYVAAMLTQHWPLELHGVIAGFFGGMWLLFVLLISGRIRHIRYNAAVIEVKNYGAWQPIAAPDYVRLTGGFPPGLYQLATTQGSYLFLPGFGSSLRALLSGHEPAEIAAARRVLHQAQMAQRSTSADSKPDARMAAFPFEVIPTDDPEEPYQLLAKFDEPALAAYRTLSDKYSRDDYRVSLIDATALMMQERAPRLLDSVDFDEEGYWLDVYVENEPALQLFIAVVCPIFQDLTLLETYIRRVADGHKD